MEKKLSATYRGFDTYTTQDHHGFIKENFKRLAEMLQEKLRAGELPPNARVLDIGCATGAFAAYLSSVLPTFRFEGIDISEELIAIAREKVPNARFEVGSVFSLPGNNPKTFDVVLFFGVLGIFDEDEAKDALYRLIESTRPGGFVYVFHQFNEFDIDVMVKHRRTDPSARWDGWGAGWNIYSYRTIGQWLDGKVAGHRFIDFEMPFPLAPQENPIRTWTIDMANGHRRLTNGLKLLVDLRFLEIKV
jgi:SAM-dependent methyltransferase